MKETKNASVKITARDTPTNILDEDGLVVGQAIFRSDILSILRIDEAFKFSLRVRIDLASF